MGDDDRAHLVSANIPAQSDHCLSFFYYLKGLTDGALNVLVDDGLAKKYLLWSKTGSQYEAENSKPSWINGRVTLSSADKAFKVIFEGIRGSGYMVSIHLKIVFLFFFFFSITMN